MVERSFRYRHHLPYGRIGDALLDQKNQKRKYNRWFEAGEYLIKKSHKPSLLQ